MAFDLVMPVSPLILRRPLLPLPSVFPSIRVFSKESALRIRWPKGQRCGFSSAPLEARGWFPLGLAAVMLSRDSPESSAAPQVEGVSSSARSLLSQALLYSVVSPAFERPCSISKHVYETPAPFPVLYTILVASFLCSRLYFFLPPCSHTLPCLLPAGNTDLFSVSEDAAFCCVH